MPLSRLENFLVNTDGNILYVNPSDLDATDSFDNKGNSLTRPFVTIQRALIEAARFTYQSGKNNDKFDRTTVLLYPGEHVVDNRPGLYVKDDDGTAQYIAFNGDDVTGSTDLELKNSSIFNLNSANNILAKFNSVHGGVIVPKGTSIIGLDLRKTKIRPLYVPNPDVSDSVIPRSALFRVTGGCYFWQFSIFDANESVYFSKNFTEKRNPNISHHKLTCFEYADGLNPEDLTGTTDLQQYYFKLMNAYGDDTGNRDIPDYPGAENDFEPNTPESKIVGDLSADDLAIESITSSGLNAVVTTKIAHGLTVDDQILITGVGSTDLYNGTYRVTGIGSDRQFNYNLNSDANDDVVNIAGLSPKVTIEADTVTGASPYIFNCSLRSVFGMCGLHADGSKATGFKSMVVAQFTGIGLQKDDKAFVIYKESTGDYLNSVDAAADPSIDTPLYLNPKSEYRKGYDNFHIKVSNDSFIQAVSVFAIGFANHFLAESGGEQSITNSNSNFGNKALVSKGFKPNAFARDDTGYVTHIVPPKDLQKEESNIIWTILDPEETKAAATTNRLYIDGATDESNPPNSVVNGFRIGAKRNDKLFLNVPINKVPTLLSSPILMQVASGDGPSAEKKFTVERDSSGNEISNTKEITLTESHNFLKGESVRVFSDDGRTPDGIEIGRKYFVIPVSGSGNESKIKLANTVNDALADRVIIDDINRKGGVLTIQSTVTDKISGEIGHPIQYDSTRGQWYITGSSDAANTIYSTFNTGTNAADIAKNNSSAYVSRKSESRALNDRIYRLRYVIPKDFKGANIAKRPEKNYSLQESKTITEQLIAEETTISNRNPKVIAGITSTSSVVTVTTEIPHKLSVNDKVRINNVRSVRNITGLGNTGFNGLFTVTSTPSSKIFTYGSEKLAGEFIDDLYHCRTTNTGEDLTTSDLPSYQRSEYDTTYTIQEVETIQDYISEQQDGVYYLTCLIGNISPTVSEFSDSKYRQNSANLYPTIDKDNPDNDPSQSVSAASNSILGKVNVNNPINSITKESTLNYLRDNRVGFAITNGISESQNTGLTTITSNVEHNLNAITNLNLTVAGSGYGGGISTTLYNVSLVDADGGAAGNNATAKVFTTPGGNIDTVEITDGGSAYGVGTTLSVSGGIDGVVEVTGINNSVGKAIQVIGVGITDNRNNSNYNGLFKIHSVPSTKSVAYKRLQVGTNVSINAGIFTGPAGNTNGIFLPLDDSVDIVKIESSGSTSSTVAGIVTVTTQTSHGLAVGNKIKLEGFINASGTNYNGYDFIVNESISKTIFSIDTGSVDERFNLPADTTDSANAYLLKYSLNSYGQDTSLASEKIAGSLTPLLSGFSATMNSDIGEASTVQDLTLTSTVGVSTGDFLQVDNEIMRVKSKISGTQVRVLRGVFGTQSVSHGNSSIVRKLNVVPSELHRFSAIRASGHTFEYIGYGPGNYSTSLPQKIKKQIEPEKELLAISREEKGGIVFFSGMNDRGDFFSGQRAEPRELFLGEIGDSNSAIFDDVFIRNTLRVGGGPNQNFPSEFNGPVNFSNKITSTDSKDGIEAIKLLIKGNALNNAFFQVGEDAAPSLIVNKNSKNVGINTLNPNTDIQLDIDGTVRANKYENFKLSDLPDATEEPNYARNRIIKIKNDASGYELIDPHELSAFELRSLGVSNDDTVYTGIGSIVGGQLQISGISTSKFFIDERVKIFGVTEASDSVTVNDPIQDATVKVEQVPSVGFATDVTYYYWQAQYHMQNGKVGISSQIDPTGAYSGTKETARVGVTNVALDSFNGTNHNGLTLSRTDKDHGLLIYRQNFTHPDGNNATIDQKTSANNASLNQAKLIAILGKKELGEDATGSISWKDFGVYEQTFWSPKGEFNEYLGVGQTTINPQIHFPTIGTEGQRRGWDIDKIVAIGDGNIRVSGNYKVNFIDGVVGFGTTTSVNLVHDNTRALNTAINNISLSGGNYLNLPSGTYLTNTLALPTKFSLRGNGKNSIIKLQHFATDATDEGVSGGNAISFDGILVGAAVTDAVDMTISDITFDGNSSNNLLFASDDDNSLMFFEGGTSMLFKDMEIRNSSGSGLLARNSKRISVENCTIVDGGLTDRYPTFRPLDVQNSETVRVNGSLFENFAGSLDLSVTSVTATGGNIIRNCGAGLDVYATGKITTTNNVILGPSDEFIASPDIFDTDFDSINITIDADPAGVNSRDFYGPELLYIENGEGKDVSEPEVKIVAGIGTIIGLYSTTRTATLDEKFVEFEILTQNSSEISGRDAGFIQLKMNSATIDNSVLPSYVGSSTALGYEIIATEYLQKPIGFTTFIGITSGYWAGHFGQQSGGTYVDVPISGIAVTQYVLRIEDANQMSGISTGDIVKIPGHSMNPNLTDGLKEGDLDENGNAIAADIGLRVEKILSSDQVVLTGFKVDAFSHGSEPAVGDYISIRRIFTIAKGRVGVN